MLRQHAGIGRGRRVAGCGRSATVESERERFHRRRSQIDPLRTVGLPRSRQSVAGGGRETGEQNGQVRYWITSSARSKRDCGIVKPSALAVVRLITNSNLVGCAIARSPGFAPRRILST